MQAQVNINSILYKVLKSQKAQKAAFELVNKKVIEKQEILLQEFDNHIITQELLAGETLPSSAVLPDGGYGNLFSFLGFKSGSQPTVPIRKLLEDIRTIRTPYSSKRYWIIKVKVPSVDDLEKESKMVWEPGRSWINALTYGLGTFSHYMFSLTDSRFKKSRSGTAVQIIPDLHKTTSHLTRQGYVIGMLGRFVRKIRQ